MLNHLYFSQETFQNVFQNTVLMPLQYVIPIQAYYCFRSNIAFGGQSGLFVFTMALMSSDVIRVLKHRSSNTSLFAEVALLLPLPPQPLKVPILWCKQDPLFQLSRPSSTHRKHSSLPLTRAATSLPLYTGVHYIQQVQIRLRSNIHRARPVGLRPVLMKPV